MFMHRVRLDASSSSLPVRSCFLAVGLGVLRHLIIDEHRLAVPTWKSWLPSTALTLASPDAFWDGHVPKPRVPCHLGSCHLPAGPEAVSEPDDAVFICVAGIFIQASTDDARSGLTRPRLYSIRVYMPSQAMKWIWTDRATLPLPHSLWWPRYRAADPKDSRRGKGC